MIGRIEGRLHKVRPGEVIVDAGGVGYRVAITVRAFQELESQASAALWTHTQVRADAIVLFGFTTHDELLTFERLIAVAGVGPRTALAVLSGLSPGELAEAVETADVARIQRTPGVGKKTAERIVLELKGRLQVTADSVPDVRGDALSALLNLGYAQREAQRAIDQAGVENKVANLGDLLRAALQKLTR